MIPRERLGRRQTEVLDALLRGEVPPGFDPAGVEVTGRVLRSKRTAAALRAVPSLAQVTGVRERFDVWTRTHPDTGCPHEDAERFVAWLRSTQEPVPGPLHAWWAYRQVESGRRRVALAHEGGRRVLVVGAGPWVVRLAVRRTRE